MCPHKKMRREKIFMTDATFQTTVEKCRELAPVNTQIFLHKEGEPLLDNKIASRVARVKKVLGEGNEVGLNTNAMLLSEKISEELINAGLDVIYFSVDGIDKNSYESIRLNLNYETVINNIEKFFHIRKQRHSNIRVIMQMLTTTDFKECAEKFKSIWNRFPCEFYIKRMHSYLDGGHSSLTSKISARQLKNCEDPFKILVIYANGNIGLCCWDYDNEYNIGNIREDSLLNIYNNDKSNYLRKCLSEGNGSLINPCKRCARIFGEDEITKPTEDSDATKN